MGKTRILKTMKEAHSIYCPLRFNSGEHCLTTSCMYWIWKDPELSQYNDNVRYSVSEIPREKIEDHKKHCSGEIRKIGDRFYYYQKRDDNEINRIIWNYNHEKRKGYCCKIYY